MRLERLRWEAWTGRKTELHLPPTKLKLKTSRKTVLGKQRMAVLMLLKTKLPGIE